MQRVRIYAFSSQEGCSLGEQSALLRAPNRPTFDRALLPVSQQRLSLSVPVSSDSSIALRAAQFAFSSHRALSESRAVFADPERLLVVWALRRCFAPNKDIAKVRKQKRKTAPAT